jgi:hypothetical protein
VGKEVSNASDIAALKRPSLEHIVLAGGRYCDRSWLWRFEDGSAGRFVAIMHPYHSYFVFQKIDPEITERCPDNAA